MTSQITVGAAMLFTDLSPVPVTHLARALDERGFDSLWFGEHTHTPLASGYAEEFARAGTARLCDPFVLLSAAAAVSTNLRLGTSICLAAEHEPLGLAHTVATLDAISNGRVELGIGYGHSVPEMENRGLDVSHRRAILREHILAMKELWTKDVAAFDGKYVRFTDSWAWPKPVQSPHPPIHLGIHGPKGIPHLVEFCNGWLPNLVALGEEQFLDLRSQIQGAAEAAGRDPSSISITAVILPTSRSSGMMNPFWKPDAEEFRKYALTTADLEHYASLGVDRIVVSLDFADDESVEPILDHLAAQFPN